MGIECCKMLDDTPDSPTAVAQETQESTLLWMDNQGEELSIKRHHSADDATVTTDGTSLASALKQAADDHRMSFTLRDISASQATRDHDALSVASSLFEGSVATGASSAATSLAASTDVSSIMWDADWRQG